MGLPPVPSHASARTTVMLRHCGGGVEDVSEREFADEEVHEGVEMWGPQSDGDHRQVCQDIGQVEK